MPLAKKAARFFAVGLILATAVLSACTPAAMDAREDRDPLVRRARAKKNAQDYQSSVELYNKALDRHPSMARAHLELASIYDQYLEDDLRAIYHYQRYLELRPKAGNRDRVEDLIRVAKLSYAASLPDQPSEAVREIAMLKKEVDALHSLLAEKQVPKAEAQQPAVAKPSVAATKPSASAAKPVETTEEAVSETAAPTGSSQSYVVQPGDTLSRIAGKMYNDPRKWEVIFNANRAQLPSPQSVRVGQTLTIPES